MRLGLSKKINQNICIVITDKVWQLNAFDIRNAPAHVSFIQPLSPNDSVILYGLEESLG